MSGTVLDPDRRSPSTHKPPPTTAAAAPTNPSARGRRWWAVAQALSAPAISTATIRTHGPRIGGRGAAALCSCAKVTAPGYVDAIFFSIDADHADHAFERGIDDLRASARPDAHLDTFVEAHN